MQRGSESDSRCQHPIVSISNLHHRRLEFDSESLGLLALVSVLRVDVYRLVAASLFLISSTVQCHRKKRIVLYSVIKMTKEGTFTIISRVVVVRHVGGLLCAVGLMVSLF